MTPHAVDQPETIGEVARSNTERISNNAEDIQELKSLIMWGFALVLTTQGGIIYFLFEKLVSRL